MQKKVNNNQNLQQQSQVTNLPQQVIQFFDTRIQTEQAYAKALQKLNNKFPNIETNPTQSSRVLKHLKGIHSEKYHQTIHFIQQLKQQKNTFQMAIQKSNQQLQKAVNQVRIHETNLRNIIDKVNKLFIKGEEQIRNIDEKFILRELTLLSNDYRVKKTEQSIKLLEQQQKLCLNLQKQYEQLKNQGQKTIKKIKKNQKIIHQTSPQIQIQIIQLVKRYTVQQVSLIRNLQYDIDIMIKKTNIFDQVPPQTQTQTQTQNQNKQSGTKQKSKPPKNNIIKAAKDIFKNQFKIKDPFQNIKKTIANLTEQNLKNSPSTPTNSSSKQSKPATSANNPNLENLIKAWNQNKNIEYFVTKLNQNFQENRDVGLEFIEYFRNKNINKFPQNQFTQLQKVFNVLLAKSVQEKNFANVQRLIIYGSCYFCQLESPNPKNPTTQTLMESVAKKQQLSDPYFWKFLLFFVIHRSVVECINIQNEKQIHLKNNVFSSLVSNSLNMIGCGIDKYVTKNMVAKMGKSFGIGDKQINDLLKFIDTGYQKYQKQRTKK